MDRTEMESLVKQLKAAGLNEEQIMETFYETFQEGKMDRKDLEACAEFMGYELTDDFKNDPTPDPIASGGEGGEGITKEEAEAAKEIKPGESAEEFKQAVEGEGEQPKGEQPAPEAPKEGAEEAPKGEEPKSESKPEEEVDEDKEWEEVQKKFNW